MYLPWHKPAFEALLARRDRLPHALLIRGGQGIGKEAFAKALAAALLCERPRPDGAACAVCQACGWLEQGSHPDLRVLEPKAAEDTGEAGEGREKKAGWQIDVHQVRDLADFVNLTTQRGGARVALIRPAEGLNVHAANALLKSLEEPPPRTHFLLVAHRWHRLLPTIRSRCQDLALPPPEPGAALSWLAAQGSPDAELALAQAGGAPLLAAALDQDYRRARTLLLDLVAAADFDPLRAAEALRDMPPELVVALLQKWSFDIALQAAAGRVRYNPDRAKVVAELARRLPALEVLRFQRRMVRLQREVNHPLNARLFLEDVLLDYARLLRAPELMQAA